METFSHSLSCRMRPAVPEAPRERPRSRAKEALGNLRRRIGPKAGPALRKTAGIVGRGLRKAPKAGVQLARGLANRLKKKK